jgi:flagellar motor switch protein FliM
MNDSTEAVLKKKLSRIQTRGYNFPVQSKLAAKLEYAAAKGATEALGVAVEALVEKSRVDRFVALMNTLPGSGLFILLRAPGGDSGFAGFDMALVDHVVEVMAGGSAIVEDARPPRPPTAIDTAFCMPVLDAVLAHFYAELNALAGTAPLPPFAKGRVEHMPANLQYLLPDQQYLYCRLKLSTGNDTRSGVLHLALPLSWIEPVETVLRNTSFSPAQAESEIWGKQMRKVVRRAPLQLSAIIDRSILKVAELARLEVGGLYHLADATLDDVVVMLQSGAESRQIGRGRLGVYKRRKAIRLHEIAQEDFLSPLASNLDAGADHE